MKESRSTDLPISGEAEKGTKDPLIISLHGLQTSTEVKKDLKDPLNGLRGLLAFYIGLYHYFGFYPTFHNLHGTILMPMFYLISGYSLALGYGAQSTISWRKFFRNRFARIAPMYYLTNFVVFPVVGMVRGTLQTMSYQDIALAATCTSSWFFKTPMAIESWTINTLFFFYLVFPAVLPFLQRLSDMNISRLIVFLNLVQLTPILYLMNLQDKELWNIFNHPVIELPVFIMGCLGGIQTLRWMDNKKLAKNTNTAEDSSRSFLDPNEDKYFLHDIIPWSISWSKTEEKKVYDEEKSVNIWAKRADRSAAVLVSFFIFATWNLDPTIKRCTAYYAPFLLVHVMLVLIIGLSRVGSKSAAGWVLCLDVCQFFGFISMCFYLLHFRIKRYFDVAKMILFQEAEGNVVLLNLLDILLLLLVSTAAAWLCTTYVEVPLNKLIRSTAGEGQGKRTEK